MKAGKAAQLLFSLIFLGAGGYLIWHFVGRPDLDDVKTAYDDFDFGDFTDVLGNWTDDIKFDDLFDNDPFVGDNSTNAWPSSGNGGLQLELLNALDDTWQNEFAAAVLDWEEGDPDTLTLTVKEGEVDNACTAKDGLMKVCNGNYGDTGWLGINEMLISGGSTIDSSVAKMNEYYLRNADNDKRQYTMCHEIGHGFGLPHTDEQFGNADLGNCLDYTNNPSANLHPDLSNYNRLKDLYGTVGGRRQLRPQKKSFTPELMEKYQRALAELEQVRMNNPSLANSGWRRLGEHAHGGHFVRRLDETYTLKVQMLYAGST